MTTSSNRALVRVIPVAVLLAVVLAVALVAAPDTFRYHGWPKPAPATAPQSLVGLTPELDAHGPQVAVSGVFASHSAGSAGGRLAGRSPRAAGASPAGGSALHGPGGRRPVDGQAQRVAAGRGQNGSARHGGTGHAKRAPAGKPAAIASEARFARHAASSLSARPRPVSRLSFYARVPRERPHRGRHLGWARARAAGWSDAGSGRGRHRG